MKKILVPTDFSDIAQNAFDFAVQLAKKTDAEILLLHAIEIDYSSFVVSGEVLPGEMDIHYQAELIKGSEKRIAALLEEIEGADIRSKMVIDDPENAIERMIAKYGVDLVVMGSKGAKGLKEMLVGSHTEKIIRRVSCPVITIKGETDLKTLRKIMFATDLSEESVKTANVVNKMHELLDLDIELLCVKREIDNIDSQDVQENMKTYLQQTDISSCGLNVMTDDSVEDGILEAAERLDAGIIAMATHGRKGVMHLLMGSHTENVANHASRPVMSVSTK